MNYIAEIKAFYDLVQVKQLSTGQIALWHALMYISNKCAWTEWFTVPNLTLELHTGLSRSGIYKARNTLKQYGLIDFKPNGTKATSYKINSLLKSNQDSKQDEKQNKDTLLKSKQDGKQIGNQDGKQDGKQIGNTLNKRNETKQKNIDNDDNNSRPGFVDVYEQEFGQLITPSVFQKLHEFLLDGMSDEVVSEAIRRASENGVYNLKYITTILQSWQKQNVVDMAGVQRVDAAFDNWKKRKTQIIKPQSQSGKSKMQRSLANIQKVLLDEGESEGLF